MSMSSLADSLRTQFQVEDKTPFGPCIIVPSRNFKPEWEQQLRGEGYKVFMQSNNGESAFFIRLTRSNSKFRKKWTESETRMLKELAATDLSLNEIAEKLGRTRLSIQGRMQRMKISRLSTPQPVDTPKPSPDMAVDTVKEFLSAVNLLYPSHRQAAAFLLKEVSTHILAEEGAQ